MEILCASELCQKKNTGLSKATWYKAIRELVAAELIICTRDPFILDNKTLMDNVHGRPDLEKY